MQICSGFYKRYGNLDRKVVDLKPQSTVSCEIQLFKKKFHLVRELPLGEGRAAAVGDSRTTGRDSEIQFA